MTVLFQRTKQQSGNRSWGKCSLQWNKHEPRLNSQWKREVFNAASRIQHEGVVLVYLSYWTANESTSVRNLDGKLIGTSIFILQKASRGLRTKIQIRTKIHQKASTEQIPKQAQAIVARSRGIVARSAQRQLGTVPEDKLEDWLGRADHSFPISSVLPSPPKQHMKICNWVLPSTVIPGHVIMISTSNILIQNSSPIHQNYHQKKEEARHAQTRNKQNSKYQFWVKTPHLCLQRILEKISKVKKCMGCSSSCLNPCLGTKFTRLVGQESHLEKGWGINYRSVWNTLLDRLWILYPLAAKRVESFIDCMMPGLFIGNILPSQNLGKWPLIVRANSRGHLQYNQEKNSKFVMVYSNNKLETQLLSTFRLTACPP